MMQPKIIDITIRADKVEEIRLFQPKGLPKLIYLRIEDANIWFTKEQAAKLGAELVALFPEPL
jgi:hypothetical protein